MYFQPSQLALAWCLRTEGITGVIVGARTPAHVEQNMAAADVDVPEEVRGADNRLRSATTYLAKEGGS
jgi:aryl-alcohol dehydrogenase-like predicted oxidoreductase